MKADGDETIFGQGFVGEIDTFVLFSVAFVDNLVFKFSSEIPSWFAPVRYQKTFLIFFKAIEGLWLFDEIVGSVVYDDLMLVRNAHCWGCDSH